MTSSRTQKKGRTATSGGATAALPRGHRAHDMKSNRREAMPADLQDGFLPCLAGPVRHFSPGGQGASFKDPSSHNARRFLRCWQPSRVSSGLFLTRGCVDRALRIGAIQHSQFGDGCADGFVKWLPCVGSLHVNSMEHRAWKNPRLKVPDSRYQIEHTGRLIRREPGACRCPAWPQGQAAGDARPHQPPHGRELATGHQRADVEAHRGDAQR